MTFRATEHPYFEGSTPRVFAHRGLHVDVPENTASSFRAALTAGATFIETDVVGSKDGVAIISHDTTLDRVSTRTGLVSDYTAAELADIDLGGEGFLTLAQALEQFPTARLNIDVKDETAIEGVVRAVTDAEALNRVLITSFNAQRRRSTIARLPGVASSPSATTWGYPDAHATVVVVNASAVSCTSRLGASVLQLWRQATFITFFFVLVDEMD
jgi:glycerophosphoryl diester phosphodiesterase